MSDMVNHPKHYKAKNGMETIDVIDAFTEGLEGYEAAYTANILRSLNINPDVNINASS